MNSTFERRNTKSVLSGAAGPPIFATVCCSLAHLSVRPPVAVRRPKPGWEASSKGNAAAPPPRLRARQKNSSAAYRVVAYRGPVQRARAQVLRRSGGANGTLVAPAYLKTAAYLETAVPRVLSK